MVEGIGGYTIRPGRFATCEVRHRKSPPGTPPSSLISAQRVAQGPSGHTPLRQHYNLTLFDDHLSKVLADFIFGVFEISLEPPKSRWKGGS